MHILVIDGEHIEAEFRQKFGSAHEYTFFSTEYTESAEWERISREIKVAATKANVAFCFTKRDYNSMAYLLFEGTKLPVFSEIVSVSLTESRWQAESGLSAMEVFGFCGLPTLLNRPLLEVSLYNKADREKLAETCTALGTDYRVVEDRVGLVTPRVICMIINEAFYTVQEGTATMQDVDLGMKLGTNYPRGPFAWANAIGVERVYAVLEALWNDTHDERYKVCPLLKRQALRGEPFQTTD
ncbi:MAG TPA: 3-hydroxyacyl-CoA dehydrogenase family protein [Hymenobacter sp.]|jgi:3-hydroxybutyryl-CoA dehydrogenase